MHFDFNPQGAPPEPEILEKTRHRFVLKGDVVDDGFFEVEQETAMDTHFGSVSQETHSLHKLGCHHVVGSPEQLAGHCKRCRTSMCKACQIRCGRCLALLCPDCVRVMDGNALCKKCRVILRILRCFGLGLFALHESFKRKF